MNMLKKNREGSLMVKRSQLVQVGIFLILLHPFYVYILNTFKVYQMPLTLVSILLFSLAMVGKRELKIDKWILVWCVFFTMMLINNKGAGELINYFYVMMFMSICLINIYGWESGAIKVLLAMTFPHALTTVVLFLNPNLYVLIKPLLTYQSIFFEGYKTALTGHYTTNSVYISIGVIIVTCMIFVEEKKKNRKYLIILDSIYMIALLLTTKRGPLIFSLASLFITYILLDRCRIANRIVKIVGVAIFLIVLFYVLAGFIPELSEVLKRFSSDGTSGRNIMYALAFSMFRHNIFFGAGTGSYKYRYSMILANDSNHKYLNVHNVYIQLLCENGVIGFILFITVALGTLVGTVILLRKIKSKYHNKIKMCMSISLAYQIFFLMYCMTENPLYDNMLYIPYFILISIFYSFKNNMAAIDGEQ